MKKQLSTSSNINMLCLKQSDFLDYISNTSKPINLEMYDLAADYSDLDCDSFIKRFNDALNKNTKSTKLVISSKIWNDCNITPFFDGLRIPPTIKTLGISRLNYPKKLVLPSNITKLLLWDVGDISKIDFSENTGLKVIKIQVRYRHQINVDLTHVYKLHKFCLNLEPSQGIHEKDGDNIMKHIKLPYGYETIFTYKCKI